MKTRGGFAHCPRRSPRVATVENIGVLPPLPPTNATRAKRWAVWEEMWGMIDGTAAVVSRR